MSYLTQKTVKEHIQFSGVALHSGLNVNISIKPADVNFGIVFKRVDIQENNLVYPNFMNVTNTSLNTTATVDISALLASGNIDDGQKVFKKCSACHSVKKGGKNKIGPALYNIIGRDMAELENYKYSKALIAFGKSWTFEEMNSFLIKPQTYIKGTKMAFAGLKKEKDRASVILYMNQNSDNPLPLPLP